MSHLLTTFAASKPAEWLGTTWEDAGLVAISTVAIFGAVIAFSRIAGLRSFSQMSSFDFAMTVAIGSLMASTASGTSTSLLNGLVTLALLFAVQMAIAFARMRSGISEVVDNTPLVLMYRGRVLEENMVKARIAERDLWAKLRQEGITDPEEVHAVVFETTADVSVLRGPGPIDPRLLEHVRGLPEGAVELR